MNNRDLKAKYKVLFSEFTAIIYEVDPMGINSGINPSEYDSEAATILAGMRRATNVDDVFKMVVDRFDEQFGPGESARLDLLADRLWECWNRHQQPNP